MHELYHKANGLARTKDLEGRADSQSSFGCQTSRLSITIKPCRKSTDKGSFHRMLCVDRSLFPGIQASQNHVGEELSCAANIKRLKANISKQWNARS
jgi:hypothetical protein